MLVWRSSWSSIWLSAMAGVAWRAMTPAARREAVCEEGIGLGGRAMSSGFFCRQQRRVIATRGAPSHELPARAEYYVAETSFKHLARAKPAEDSPRVAGSRAKAGVLLISATQSREISHLASIGGGGHGDGRLGLGGGLRLDEGLAGEHGSSGGNGSHFDEYKARLRSGSVRI